MTTFLQSIFTKIKSMLLYVLFGSICLMIAPKIEAVTILSGPTFNRATNAPLAGLLELTTDVDSRISVLVSDGTGVWQRDFYDYSTSHSVPLVGFKPDQTNQILVTVYDENRNSDTAPQLLTFVTAPLPEDFPTYKVFTNEPDQMEPGYMLFDINRPNYKNGNYITIMDNDGNIVWYSPVPITGPQYLDVRQLDNGNLFIQLDQSPYEFIEMNMLGQIIRTWQPPSQFPINLHEGIVTSHGTILYLSDASEVVPNFPASDTVSNPPTKTATVDDNPIVEISYTNGALLHAWSPVTNGLIDPTRVTYLTYGEYSGSTVGTDSEHANALIDDTNDNSIIVSMRNQNAVFKFSRATGKLIWILGPHALWGTNWQQYLLTPVGMPFNWNYGQHAPELTPQGTLLVYNDNPYQASPYDTQVADQDNYSSAVEYSIDETNMTVSEVWNSAWQTNQDRFYTPIVGRVQWLPQTRNIFVDYGFVAYANGVATHGSMVRLIEYTHDPVPKVVFNVSFAYDGTVNSSSSGYDCYRAYQIPDFYSHPAESVTDLTVHDDLQNIGQVAGQSSAHIPVLEFSADPTHNYVVQASTDLKSWTTVGSPTEEGDVGDFDFYDLNAYQFKDRFYRIVTQ